MQPAFEEWRKCYDPLQSREPLAASVYANIRNYPLPYGPPAACRTIRDDELVRQATGFLVTLKYFGVAHLDFRRDRRNGQANLLDFNVRLAGTNDISLHSGINFPLMLYELALGRRVTPRFASDGDLEVRWLYEDLLRALHAPDKWDALLELLRWRRVAL